MRFLLRLFRFRTQNPGFFYFREQVDYERRLEAIRSNPHYPFKRSA
jgi:hypothetical protein